MHADSITEHSMAVESAFDAFRRSSAERDDPAAPFAEGMRACCRGIEIGDVLSGSDRAHLSLLIQCAEQALHRAAVPFLIAPQRFDSTVARMADLLTVWAEPQQRASWEPDYTEGFVAMIRLLANDVEYASLTPAAIRGIAAGRTARPAETRSDSQETRNAALSLTRH